MNRFKVGDVVSFQGEICRVSALRGRSREDWVGDSGFVEVVKPVDGSHRKPGDSLFAWASQCREVDKAYSCLCGSLTGKHDDDCEPIAADVREAWESLGEHHPIGCLCGDCGVAYERESRDLSSDERAR